MMEKRAARKSKSLARNPKKGWLEVACVVWAIETHSLFDYQSENYKMSSFMLEKDCQLEIDPKTNEIRKWGDKLKPKGLFGSITCAPLPLLRLHDRLVGQVFHAVKVRKDTEDGALGHPVTRGNVLKIGKVVFRVVASSDSPDSKFKAVTVAEVDSECKFCLDKAQTPENVLVSPCLCTALVHLRCLRDWALTMVEGERRGRVSTVSVREMACKVCKGQISRSIRYGEQWADLLEFEGNYIVLEEENTGTLHIVQRMEQLDSIVFGRINQADVCIQDISVSRIHSQLTCVDRRFLLSDRGSKFGTLVMAEEEIPVKERTTLQVGRTLLVLNPN